MYVCMYARVCMCVSMDERTDGYFLLRFFLSDRPPSAAAAVHDQAHVEDAVKPRSMSLKDILAAEKARRGVAAMPTGMVYTG